MSMQKTATKPGQSIQTDPNTGWTSLQNGPSMDQSNQFNSTLNPQNLYNQYAKNIFGQDYTGFESGTSNTPNPSTQLPQQVNSQIPTHTEQVQAQVPDYGPMVQSMQQYVQSMQQLLDQINQR